MVCVCDVCDVCEMRTEESGERGERERERGHWVAVCVRVCVCDSVWHVSCVLSVCV